MRAKVAKLIRDEIGYTKDRSYEAEPGLVLKGEPVSGVEIQQAMKDGHLLLNPYEAMIQGKPIQANEMLRIPKGTVTADSMRRTYRMLKKLHYG